MTRMWRLGGILSIACCFSLCTVPPASGEDLFPPSWRGSEGTTFARWEYGDSNLHPAPDDQTNPFGTSWTDIQPEAGEQWQPLWGGREGVWPLSGAIEVQIDNRWPSPPEYYKDIRLQLSWAAQSAGATPTVFETLFMATGSVINNIAQEPIAPPADGEWYHTTYLIHLEPNPAWEIIRIEGDIMVDGLVIDTICIPEPATLGLLAAAGVALCRRRRV